MNAPSFLTAQWRHLAMVNYEIDADKVRPLVPAGTEVDFFHGKTFISLVGFMFLETRVRGFCIPWHSSFEEVNLRFYVRRKINGEVRRGVAFVKEIAPRRAITAVARWVYGENYHTHRMRHEIADKAEGFKAEYSWSGAKGWNRLCVTGKGPPLVPVEGSEEQFITEHYWGYTRQGPTKTLEYRVDHPSWRILSSCAAEVECDAELLYGSDFATAMNAEPTSCLLAEGSPVTVHHGTQLHCSPKPD